MLSLRLRPVTGLVCAIALLHVLSSFVAAAELSATRIGSRIDVMVGGDFFTSYRFSTDEKYPFFFPVNAPSGATVTSMRNGKYPHHSSLFFGCDKVNGGNYWQDKLEAGQIFIFNSIQRAIFQEGFEIGDTSNWSQTLIQ